MIIIEAEPITRLFISFLCEIFENHYGWLVLDGEASVERNFIETLLAKGAGVVSETIELVTCTFFEHESSLTSLSEKFF